MKKYFIALVASLALFSACNKSGYSPESITTPENEQQEYTFNFNFVKGDDSDLVVESASTKAVKDSWSEGDIVRVFFSGLSEGYLELTYTAGEWALDEEGISASQVAGIGTKKCAAVWVDGNAVPQFSAGNWNLGKDREMLIDADVDFTVENSVITASFILKQHSQFTKVTVTGISGNNWTLAARPEWGIAAKSGAITLASNCASSSVLDSTAPYNGVECEDGVYFFVVPASVERTSFKISDGSTSYVRTYANNIYDSKGKAVKLKGIGVSGDRWLETSDVLYVNGSTTNYVDGTALSWTVSAPVAIPLVNGKYTFTLSHFSNFGMSTKTSASSDWNVWNKNFVGIPSDIKAGVPTATIKSWDADGKSYSSNTTTATNRILWDGTFLVEVTENFDKITMTPKYVYIAGNAAIKVNEVNLPGWNIATPARVELNNGAYTFTIETPNDNYNIDLSTVYSSSSDWGQWNAGKISPSPKTFDAGTLNLLVNTDGWYFSKAGKYNVEINSTLTSAVVTRL